jgi:hypothetical protein
MTKACFDASQAIPDAFARAVQVDLCSSQTTWQGACWQGAWLLETGNPKSARTMTPAIA